LFILFDYLKSFSNDDLSSFKNSTKLARLLRNEILLFKAQSGEVHSGKMQCILVESDELEDSLLLMRHARSGAIIVSFNPTALSAIATIERMCDLLHFLLAN